MEKEISDNKNNKETFESYWNKLFNGNYYKNENLEFSIVKFMVKIKEAHELKQLHDKSIREEIEKAFKNDELINNWIEQKCIEKDKQIQELQAENEKLKKDLQKESDLTDEEMDFFKQNGYD